MHSAPVSYRHPTKERSTAMLLEILPGLFGIYGIGWIYGNNTTTGLILLIGGLVWLAIAVVIDIITVGFGVCFTLPINIIVIVVSAIMLNKYTQEHPELFS